MKTTEEVIGAILFLVLVGVACIIPTFYVSPAYLFAGVLGIPTGLLFLAMFIVAIVLWWRNRQHEAATASPQIAYAE